MIFPDFPDTSWTAPLRIRALKGRTSGAAASNRSHVSLMILRSPGAAEVNERSNFQEILRC